MEASDFAVSLLIGTLFVYGVGIAVPALVRFVFYKKPLSKGAAIGVLVIWWFVLFILIYALKGGNQPNAFPLVIVVIVSYGILTKKDKVASAPDEETKKQIQS